MLVTLSCPTLSSPMDCSPPGFSVHGILQARILEWVAISYSRASSHPFASCIGRWVLYRLSYQGSPRAGMWEHNVWYFLLPRNDEKAWIFYPYLWESFKRFFYILLLRERLFHFYKLTSAFRKCGCQECLMASLCFRLNFVLKELYMERMVLGFAGSWIFNQSSWLHHLETSSVIYHPSLQILTQKVLLGTMKHLGFGQTRKLVILAHPRSKTLGVSNPKAIPDSPGLWWTSLAGLVFPFLQSCTSRSQIFGIFDLSVPLLFVYLEFYFCGYPFRYFRDIICIVSRWWQ